MPTPSEKFCPTCKVTKPTTDFPPSKYSKDGFIYQCRDCHRTYKRSYALAHKKEISEFHKEYRVVNRDRLLSHKKQYREENKEQINAKARDKYRGEKEARQAKRKLNYSLNRDKFIVQQKKRRGSEEYKEQMKIYLKGYYQQNKTRLREQNKSWKEENKELVRMLSRRHIVRRKGNGGGHSLEEWEYLKQVHDYRCLKCGKREPDIKLTKDHIVPVSKGGTDNIGNLQPLCHSCNSSKNDKFLDLRQGNQKRGKKKS